MPPKKTSKKRKAEEESEEPQPKQKEIIKTPLDIFWENAAIVKQREGCLGYIIIQGVKATGNEEVGPDQNKIYSQDQINELRVVLINEKREKSIDHFRKLILGDQAGDSIMIFDTSFSDQVFFDVQKSIKSFSRKPPSDRFDALFALTFTINRHDSWLYDLEDPDELENMLAALSKAWKTLLALSDTDLKIDPEYTRPGIMSLLNTFQEKLSDTAKTIGFEQKFKF